MPKISFTIITVFILSLFITKKNIGQTIKASLTEACAPTPAIQFTGLAGATNILWNFGDGTSSAINNPVHSFSSPNNYIVTYKATVSGSTLTQTLSIKARPKPTPNFTVNITQGCIGTTFSFKDLSVASTGTLAPQWQWSFGDGGVSSAKNPNYIYTLPGTFNVTFVYKDEYGCDSSIIKSGLIKVSAKPTVLITNIPASINACAVPFTATFSGSASSSNSTTGSTALTYSWNLNGATSTSVNPSPVTFTTTGSFPVSLSCTDNNNCTNSKTVTVTVQSTIVKALVPIKACYNQPVIIRDSSLATSTKWDFGDGTPIQTVVVPNQVSHTYSSAGIFTITATTVLGTCSAVKTFTINVEKVVANFTAIPPFGCTSPLVVTYSNTSTGASTYTWSFSNGGTSTLANPTHTFTQGSLNPYTIFQPLLLQATLIAASPGGCSNSITLTLDTLQRPTAFFYTDKNQGCNPLTVTFTNTSTSPRPITNYSWNFGDASALNSGTTNTLVTHTYTTPGVYYATLVIQNILGCKDTSFKWPIHVSSPPHTSFSFSPSVVCPNQPVTITNLTPLADSVNQWHVISDGTYFSHCMSDPNPSWMYSHTGAQPITLSAYSYGCKHDTTLPATVTVKGSIVSGRFFTRCDSPKDVKFDILLQDASFAEIRYGDGDRDTVYASGSHTISHTYTNTGNYTAIIKGENTTSGCIPDYDTLLVKVRVIKSVITSQSITCTGVPTSYSGSLSQDVDGVGGVGYIWFFGNDPPIITSNASTNYTLAPGTQSVTLVVKDVNGCRDTSRTSILVSYVNANAILSNTIGCMPSFSLNATQSATSNTTITGYSWSFGDGSAAVTGSTVAHTYTTASSPSTTYNMVLTVTNINGCIGTKTFPVVMNFPAAPVIQANSPVKICAGKIVSLSTTATGVNTYTWTYGDGAVTTTTSNAVSHTYTVGGNFNGTLLLADAAGCKAKLGTFTVQVQDYPKAIISFTNTNNPIKQNACAGSTVLFSDNSINPYSPQTHNWNLGNGSLVVDSPKVGNTYVSAGIYTVSLTNCTPFGCCNTTTTQIKVYSASANFDIDKTTICKGDAITFTIKDSTNVLTWGWDFGDGTNFNTSAQSPKSHIYNFHPPGGTTNASMTYYTSDSACKYALAKPINISAVIADFDRNNETSLIDTAHCIGTTDIFTNTSLISTGYNWNFGDGQTSSDQNPTHLYTAAGTYTVQFVITDNVTSCKDTTKKVMTIFSKPALTLSGRDTCQNRPIQLSAIGGVTYTWSPSFGLNNPNSSNPIATLNSTTIFSVTTGNIQGCVGSNTLQINIIEPVLPIQWDTTIVIGQAIPLPGYVGVGYSYTWTPIDYLSCTQCINPIASPTVQYVYTLTIKDNFGCFSKVLNTYTVNIDPKTSVDVPTAFTPNGDGINDLINVDGWGIRKLNYFKVYNRWGELLYETTDLKSGWDGFYKGVPQNMETYIYQAEVESFVDTVPVKKTGYFKLLR